MIHLKLYNEKTKKWEYPPTDTLIDNETNKEINITKELKSFKQDLINKVDKDKVVTSINGMTGNIKLEDILIEKDFLSMVKYSIGGYGYIDGYIETSIDDGDNILWNLSQMTNESVYIKLDIYTLNGDKIISSANIKDETNKSLKQSDLYGKEKIIMRFRKSDENFVIVSENTPSTKTPLKKLIADKADKSDLYKKENVLSEDRKRKITISSMEPISTSGEDGDIWLQYN